MCVPQRLRSILNDIFMIDDSVQGFFSNPLGYKYFMHCTIAK